MRELCARSLRRFATYQYAAFCENPQSSFYKSPNSRAQLLISYGEEESLEFSLGTIALVASDVEPGGRRPFGCPETRAQRRGGGDPSGARGPTAGGRGVAPSAGDPQAMPYESDLSIFLTIVKSRISARIRRNSNEIIRLYNTNSLVGFGFIRLIFALFPQRAHPIAAVRDRARL